MKFLLGFFVLLILLIITPTTGPSYAAAPTFGPNILISTYSNSNSSSGPPILDIDVAGGVYVAWVGQDSNNATDIFFSKLSPNGSNFESTEPLTEINDQKSSAQIEEDDGNIYIAWHERRVTGGVIKDGVFFTKSADGGQTFTEEIFIDPAVGLPISMAAYDGQVYIAYSIVKEVCCFNQWSEIWIARSTDRGNSFTKSRVAGCLGCGASDQRPAVDFQSSNVYVSWYDYSGIKFAKSADGGNTFDAARYVYNPGNSAVWRLGNTFGRMSLEVSHLGAIFIAFDFFLEWDSPLRFDSEVFLMKSLDNGTTFTAARRLSADSPDSRIVQQRPSLTILPDGSPSVSWQEGDTLQKIMFIYSEDQGESFSPNFRINNTELDRAFFAASIAADREGQIHFVRWDSGLSPFGLYYTKIDLDLQFDTPPTPFLDLPWDYESKGLSFTEAALAINSYFDHEYPLLSSGLNEPAGTLGYDNTKPPQRQYTSHDGYDYGKSAEVNIGDPVLATADGCASYFKNGASGNAIKIDHGNGYQTRYYHLSDNDLVTKSETCIDVIKGQQIGRVGATGNVIPPGTLGAHIHFMVIQDKNNDGDFEDNIPDGITDPFGWQSEEQDPWPAFAFNYKEQDRTGNESFYLWTKAIDNLSDQLTSNGGFFELNRFKLNFPQNATSQTLNIEIESAPIAKPSNILHSIGSTIIVIAKDALGNLVHSFGNLFTITVEFDGFDLTNYNTQTISIYSSEDGVNWTKEQTTINLDEKTASAQVDHLSHFALMAERLDITAPTTAAILSGIAGQPNWFRSDVQVNLDTQDNSGGLGVDYTFYKVDDQDWQEYTGNFTLTEEGNHKVEFYSADNDENIEEVKSVSFSIDKQIPEAEIAYNTNSQRIEINSGLTPRISDLAGNSLIIVTEDFESKEIEIENLVYNQKNFKQAENSLEIEFEKKRGKIEKFVQTFEFGDLTVKISYDKKKNQSLIEKKQGKKKLSTEIKSGIVILKLNTNQGNLEYSY